MVYNHEDPEVIGIESVEKPTFGLGSGVTPEARVPAGEAEHGTRRPPTSLTSPEDVQSALPPGRAKLIGFALVFLIWWGCWGGFDQLSDYLTGNSLALGLLLHAAVVAMGACGLRMLAERYRGYAVMDEIHDMA